MMEKKIQWELGQPERNDVQNALDQSRLRNYLPENNKWNFKNDDESSWITRIRKLADM